jgi:hypothetical protein
MSAAVTPTTAADQNVTWSVKKRYGQRDHRQQHRTSHGDRCSHRDCQGDCKRRFGSLRGIDGNGPQLRRRNLSGGSSSGSAQASYSAAVSGDSSGKLPVTVDEDAGSASSTFRHAGQADLRRQATCDTMRKSTM